MGQGGLREAFVRAIIYIRLPELAADERGFTVLSKLREEYASRSLPCPTSRRWCATNF